ncbi:MAG: hypothetical protein ACFFAO_17850 [Candidatus Hermodarchaeota archaeon]
MSDIKVNKEFSEFGKKAQILGILALISFLLSIVAFFVAVVGYVNSAVQVVSLIIMILATGNIKRAGLALKNQSLLAFRSKIIIALILVLIGGIIIGVGIAGIFAIAYGPNPEAWEGYVVFGLMIIIGLIFIIVGAVLEILAWKDLKNFFTTNKSMFPEEIGNKAESGSKLMLIGAILTLTFILAFIGFILRVIGYFKLSALKDLE